jgi:hypothetical protein
MNYVFDMNSKRPAFFEKKIEACASFFQVIPQKGGLNSNTGNGNTGEL